MLNPEQEALRWGFTLWQPLSARFPSKSRDPALCTLSHLQGKGKSPTSHTNLFAPAKNGILFPLSRGMLTALHQLCARNHLDIHYLRGIDIISPVCRWGSRDAKAGCLCLPKAAREEHREHGRAREGPQRPWKPGCSSSLGDPESGRRRHGGLRAPGLWGKVQGSD